MSKSCIQLVTRYIHQGITVNLFNINFINFSKCDYFKIYKKIKQCFMEPSMFF